ncbi:MAG TPA: hypothetical protein ENK18_17200 [Deltaproteobacteria bacterium]|nr:hypothetical protein [Deltaproteobacteria bacterium]
MSASSPQQSDGNILHLVGLLVGGLILSFGIMGLPWSFGWADHECLNCDLAGVGFTGLDNIGWLPAADYSPGLIAFGLLTMIALNANAWRRTGGY